MNFLDLINSVMRRLRENTVTTISENSYSIMIGDLINDAKTTVENSHEWTSLRQTVVVPSHNGRGNVSVSLARLVAFVCDLPGLQHLMETTGGCILTLFQVDHVNGECLHMSLIAHMSLIVGVCHREVLARLHGQPAMGDCCIPLREET